MPFPVGETPPLHSGSRLPLLPSHPGAYLAQVSVQPTTAAPLGWKPAHSPVNRAQSSSWSVWSSGVCAVSLPLEAGFSLPARENLLRAQRQSLCLVKSFQSWGPLLSPLTHIQGRGLAFPSLGWQIVNLGLSRKYSDIKVIRSPADKTDHSQQSGSFHLLLVSSLCSALSLNLFFFKENIFRDFNNCGRML